MAGSGDGAGAIGDKGDEGGLTAVSTRGRDGSVEGAGEEVEEGGFEAVEDGSKLWWDVFICVP